MMRLSAKPTLLPTALPALLAVLLALVPPAAAETGPTGDSSGPRPTIGVDEVERGMKGHGYSVFAGREPERFEAEVIGVMRNTQPGTSYILARLSGHGLEESGVAGGMSGSPVFFDGRLAGAVAFAWPFSQEAVAGITPIELMRRVGEEGASGGAPAGPPRGAPPAAPVVPLADLVAGNLPPDLLERELERLVPRLVGDATPGLQWAASGFGERSEALLGRTLGPVAPLGEAEDAGAAGDAAAGLAPGAAVAAVVVDGDQRLAATGTVTDRIGDRVLAFGHPFLGLGPVQVPMATAEVVTVVASDYSSFKISNMGTIVGAIEEDRAAGLAGTVGAEAPMVPITVRIDGEREFHMRIADIPQLTPSLIAVTTLAGLDSASYAAGLQGLDVVARFRLADHGELEVRQSFDGSSAAASTSSFLLSFASYLLGNELAEVDVESVEVELTQVVRPRTATLVGVHAERSTVRPGETVTLHLRFAVWRGEEFRHRVRVKLPEDLAEGRYYLLVGDGASADAARLMVERTEPVTFPQALELLRSLHSRRELVVLGVAAGPGLAVAGEALPNLPGSMRSVWSAAGTGSATPLRLAVTQEQVEPMDVPLAGLERVNLEVKRREPLRSTAGGDGEVGSGAGGEGSGDGGGEGEGQPGAGDSGSGASAPGAGDDGGEDG